jgi:two-component system LytT family response regulator
VHARLARGADRGVAAERAGHAAVQAASGDAGYLRRIPVRQKDDIVLVPAAQLASVVADGELLHLTTIDAKRYTINYRLKDLAARLDPATFVRISRSALVNLDVLAKVSAMPGGTYLVTLTNRQQLAVSRQRARDLREQLLKL